MATGTGTTLANQGGPVDSIIVTCSIKIILMNSPERC